MAPIDVPVLVRISNDTSDTSDTLLTTKATAWLQVSTTMTPTLVAKSVVNLDNGVNIADHREFGAKTPAPKANLLPFFVQNVINSSVVENGAGSQLVKVEVHTLWFTLVIST